MGKKRKNSELIKKCVFLPKHYYKGTKMKAVYFTEHGGPEVLQYGELPEPIPNGNEVKIRVKACALNRLDIYTRAGVRGMKMDLKEPHVLGGDVSGEIVEVGYHVSRVSVGDRVVVNPRMTCMQWRSCQSSRTEYCDKGGMVGSAIRGGYAEYIVVPATSVFPIPASVSYVQAASLPTVFMPSWNILIRRAELQPWEIALVPSASSGVGTAAIQVAKKIAKSEVITTTSTEEKAEKAADLGADHVINNKAEDVSERLKDITGGRGVDVVIDHVGTDIWNASNRRLAKGARYGICGVTSGYKAELQMGAMFTGHLTMFGVYMGRSEDLEQIIYHAGQGTLKGVIDSEYSLEDARKAHEDMERLEFFGKLVITVD